VRSAIKLLSMFHVLVYRLTRGRLLGSYSGLDFLLLTTTGSKSGRRRTRPLSYLKHDEGYVLVASFGGAPRHPAWYLNLRSNPAVTIQVKGRRRSAMAETATPEERARLWPRVVAMYAAYDTYQSRTEREIPLVLVKES
jgi:deazaflavin-dependent oxidoreductase (nitroreductase family)